MINIVYAYIGIGLIITTISFMLQSRKEAKISQVVHEKLHQLKNDGSLYFHIPNTIGFLFALGIGCIFWPIILINKVMSRIFR